MREMTKPNPEIARLIDLIARDNGMRGDAPPPFVATMTSVDKRDPRRTGISGSAAIGFIIPVAIIGLVAYSYRTPTETPTLPPAVEHAAAVDVPAPVVSVAEPTPAPAPTIAIRAPRPTPPRATTPTVPRIAPPPPPPLPPPSSGVDANGKAVHLTGAALDAALAEDRIKTRQLNLGEIRDGR